VPKAIALDGDKPRRRRGSVAIETSAQRNFAMRILLYSPKDTVAGAIACLAVVGIIANAILMQAGRHPSPMFGGSPEVPTAVPAPASPLPRPRPIEAAARPAEVKPPEAKASEAKAPEVKIPEARPIDIRPVEAKPAETKPAETKPTETRSTESPAHQARPASAPAVVSTNAIRPPAPIPFPSRNDAAGDLITTPHRVASVQRALTEYGYGQLKPTGTVGSDTQAAIQKFERDRKMPVTGQISERLVRELTAVTGRSID
jgi:hypothetical protein